jgi:hypothetical protein
MDREIIFKTSSTADLDLSLMPFYFLNGQENRKDRIGFIGSGYRGSGHLKGNVNQADEGVQAICDIDVENARRAQQTVSDAGNGTPDLYTNGPEYFESYQDEFDSAVWKRHEEEALGAGYGGKDWFIRNAFVQSIKQKVTPPLDVYSAVASAAIVALSEDSIAKGESRLTFPTLPVVNG